MMNENEPSKDISLELQVLGFILNKDFYGKVKNIVSRDMFEGRYATLFDTITYGHKTYDIDIHPNQLSALVNDRNPAMPKSAVFELYDIIEIYPPTYLLTCPSNWMLSRTSGFGTGLGRLVRKPLLSLRGVRTLWRTQDPD